MSSYAPLVIFGYNRADKLEKCIQALMDCEGISHTEIFLYIDGPKDRMDENAVNEVREYTNKIKEQSWFSNIVINYQKKNRGLAESVIAGITEVINLYGRVIVLEDDIIVSPDFLLFMNGALDAFEKDKKVWSISTDTLSNHVIKKCTEDILWTYRGECWGWASWADRWNKVDWKVSDYAEFVRSRKCQREFNRGGRDMTRLLQMQQNGEINSWAIRWCYQQYKEDMITVFPKHPKSYNIGLDGSGTNCGGETIVLPETQIEKTWNFQYSMKSRTLLKEFQKKYFFGYWRQKLGGYWYALTEEEHYSICSKNGKELLAIKAGILNDYRNPMICEVRGEKYIFITIVNKVTSQKKIAFWSLAQNDRTEKVQILLKNEGSREFLSLIYLGGKYYLLTKDCKSGLYVFYQMEQDICSWKKYAILEITEPLVNAVATNIDDKIFLTGSMLESTNGNKAVFVQFEIKDFLNPERIKPVLRWKETDSNYFSIHAGNWFLREGRWYRALQKSTYKQRGKSVVVEEIITSSESGMETKMLEEMTVNSIECVLPAFIYRKLGISAYSCLGEYEIVELLVQHFSPGRLIVKLLRKPVGIYKKVILGNMCKL